MLATDLHQQLQRLEAERAAALLEGLGGNLAYMDELIEEIRYTREAYIGTAVTEIATLRAELDGPLYG